MRKMGGRKRKESAVYD